MSGRVFWLASTLSGALALLLCLWIVPGLANNGLASYGPATRSVLSGSVIISEIAWSGTAAGGTHEWIELYNNTGSAVDLAGWVLEGDDPLATLSGFIGAHEFFLLERSEHALIDISADHFLAGLLSNEGESLRLLDQHASIVDTANIVGGPWPAGTAAEHFRSMERIHPLAEDDTGNWVSNDGLTRNGLNANGQPVNGTPRMPNSAWLLSEGLNLVLNKTGPEHAVSGSAIRYTLDIINMGQADAAGVILTDTLPQGAAYLADDSHYPFSQPIPGTLVWQIGALGAYTSLSINLTVTIDSQASGQISNRAQVGTVSTETSRYDNRCTFDTWITGPEPLVLIDAVYYDGYEPQDVDEAVRLINVGGSAQDLSSWRLSDGLAETVFPQGISLGPGEGIWIADHAIPFRRQFGQSPDFEVRGADPLVPNLDGTWPGFSNSGDEVLLSTESGFLQDVLVYEDGDSEQPGWSGPALSPYVLSGVFAADGQILYRRFDTNAGARVPDTDTAMDWAQSGPNALNGRRVRYPGWDLDRFYDTRWLTETAEFVIGIAPDNAFDLLLAEIARARSDVQITGLTFRSAAVGQALIAALSRGVDVTVLLEGGPVGGITDAERHVCRDLEEAGGQCWFMVSDLDGDIHDRYRYLHAKYIIIDGRRAIISTENLSPDSLPNDEKADGTWGRRGVLIATDAPAVVSRLRAIWNADFDPANHHDLLRWGAADPTYGAPSPGSKAITLTGGISYSVRYTQPTLLSGNFTFAVIQSPENDLADPAGLLHLLAQAGPGDTILVEQLSEKAHWGSSSADPNPRLEALIDAARRGATVRLLLDSYFSNEQGSDANGATCEKANLAASLEGLSLKCMLANPTGLGLHNKMFLAEINGRGYVFVGSINGTELSNKGNREVALMLQSDAAYQLLADMFVHDWPHTIRFPVIFSEFRGRAQQVLISEVLYDPPGADDAEFIELYNPTDWPISLTGYSLGDAIEKSDFEDVRRFPAGAILNPDDTMVVATTATGFFAQFGFNPDYEILNTDPVVPDMVDDQNWGDPAAILQLGNAGDEVLLRDPAGQIIEAIAYGSGQAPGNLSCSLTTISGAGLERYPPWRDTDNCPLDFREWPFPNPGAVP